MVALKNGLPDKTLTRDDFQVFDNGNPVSIEIPVKVELKVVDAPPSITGNSGGSITKPVTLETGLVVQAPMFIKEGDVIRVDTRDGEYVERANQ